MRGGVTTSHWGLPGFFFFFFLFYFNLVCGECTLSHF